jgi:hypothetical protein
MTERFDSDSGIGGMAVVTVTVSWTGPAVWGDGEFCATRGEDARAIRRTGLRGITKR